MSEYIDKVLKLKIIKPINMDWSSFRKIINKKSYVATKFANQLLQRQYLDLKDDFEIKSQGSEYKKYKDELSSYVRDAINSEVHRVISGETGKKVLRGEATLPTFKNKSSLLIRGQRNNDPSYKGFDFFREDNDFYARLKIRSGYPSKRPVVLLGTRSIEDKSKGYYREIERVAGKKFRMTLCRVIRDKGDIYLAIHYKRPVKENNLRENKIMGIDIGVKTIWAAFNDDFKRKKFNRRTDNLIRRKDEIRKQRRKIKQNIDLRNKRRGHGVKNKTKPLKEMDEKWNNFRQTSNHKLSRAIVDYAIKNKASNMHVEDLTKNERERVHSFISNDWPVSELLDQIEYKSEEQGISTERVNPRYTSMRCPSCGLINTYFSFTYREKNDFPDFKCNQCGLQQKADYIAARNVAEPDIEEKINQQIRNQELK